VLRFAQRTKRILEGFVSRIKNHPYILNESQLFLKVKNFTISDTFLQKAIDKNTLVCYHVKVLF
jgi:hypothetical protein